MSQGGFRSTKFVNFMIPGAGVLLLGYGHIRDKVETLIVFRIFFSTANINQTTIRKPIGLIFVEKKIIFFAN